MAYPEIIQSLLYFVTKEYPKEVQLEESISVDACLQRLIDSYTCASTNRLLSIILESPFPVKEVEEQSFYCSMYETWEKATRALAFEILLKGVKGELIRRRAVKDWILPEPALLPESNEHQLWFTPPLPRFIFRSQLIQNYGVFTTHRDSMELTISGIRLYFEGRSFLGSPRDLIEICVGSPWYIDVQRVHGQGRTFSNVKKSLRDAATYGPVEVADYGNNVDLLRDIPILSTDSSL